jgi:uncharacterized protein YndB with AHSA1/START domain
MTLEQSGTLTITRRFDFPIERVFDAWLDPVRAGKFLFATPTGTMVRAEIDARVGGAFNFTDRRDGDDIEHVGTYLEIDRPRRLVFAFSVPKFSKQFTRVSIDLKPLTTGCELTLRHEGVLAEWVERTREGWGKITGTLAANLAKEAAYGVVVEPGTVRFERVVPGPIERVWSYLTEDDKRARWLAFGTMEHRVGGAFELRFEHAKLSKHQAPPPERFKDIGTPIGRERVTRFEPPRALAFTWGSEAAGASEVTIELTPQGEQVLLVLTHRRLADRQAMADVSGGWHPLLAVLVDRLNGREPAAFWSIFAETDGAYEMRFAEA